MQKLDIINMALLKCGLPLASSIDDCDWNAAFVYNNCLNEVLRSHAWSFALTYAKLSQEAAAPLFGKRYAYKLPSDCLKVLDIRNNWSTGAPRAEFIKAGEIIYTNASPCNLRYIRNCEDPNAWPPDFANSVAGRIAYEIAGLSAEKMGLIPQLMQTYIAGLQMAITADSQETFVRMPRSNNLLDARKG